MRRFMKAAAFLLALVMAFSMLTACGSSEPDAASVDAIVDAAVKAALDAAVVPTVVTIEADGKQVTIEDAANKSVQELLNAANITLNDGDLVSVPAYQTLNGNITIQVIRVYNVKVVVAAEKPEDNIQHTLVLNEGTVADAIAAAGITLAENQKADQELEKALEDDMVITITEEKVEEETEPTKSSTKSSTKTSTKTSSTKKKTNSSSNKTNSSSNKNNSSSSSSKPKPKPTTPSKTVVKTEYYDDCDGSGHGVKVITYSDGTQKEVPY